MCSREFVVLNLGENENSSKKGAEKSNTYLVRVGHVVDPSFFSAFSNSGTAMEHKS